MEATLGYVVSLNQRIWMTNLPTLTGDIISIKACGQQVIIPSSSVTISSGINLVEASIFAVCTMTLAAFNVSKAVENGKEVIPSVITCEMKICGHINWYHISMHL